jgi:hypothetical protein
LPLATLAQEDQLVKPEGVGQDVTTLPLASEVLAAEADVQVIEHPLGEVT